MTHKELGKIFASRRVERQYTQAYVAECVNVSDHTIGNIEHGRTKAEYSTLCRICKLLELHQSLVEMLYEPMVVVGSEEVIPQPAKGIRRNRSLSLYALLTSICLGVHSYGIAMVCIDDDVVVRLCSYPDLSPDREAVCQFVARCNEGGLDPIHLSEAVEDFLNRG